MLFFLLRREFLIVLFIYFSDIVIITKILVSLVYLWLIHLNLWLVKETGIINLRLIAHQVALKHLLLLFIIHLTQYFKQTLVVFIGTLILINPVLIIVVFYFSFSLVFKLITIILLLVSFLYKIFISILRVILVVMVITEYVDDLVVLLL